jgi:cytochrome c oxidase assembly protein subunit 15
MAPEPSGAIVVSSESGSDLNNTSSNYQSGLHRYAFITAGCTFVLLLAGALVTSTGSSLAVPDWPLSFGKFFPEMRGGVLFEHGHRMVAGTVALLTFGLAIYTQLVEKRSWVKKLAWSALGAVLLQAVLGGVTVLLHLPTEVSVAHAGLAQIFFCLIISLSLVTSKSWIEDGDHRIQSVGSVRKAALMVTVLIYFQILVGAVTRHSGFGLAIPDWPLSNGHLLPAAWSPAVLLQFSHTRIGAFLVLGLVNWIAFKVCIQYTHEKLLFWPAATAALLVWLQCFLGILVIATEKSIIPTSVHVITGAALLASMLVLTLNSFRLFQKGSAS